MLSDWISARMASSSWIRAMFEEGEKRRKLYGADRVFDFLWAIGYRTACRGYLCAKGFDKLT